MHFSLQLLKQWTWFSYHWKEDYLPDPLYCNKFLWNHSSSWATWKFDVANYLRFYSNSINDMEAIGDWALDILPVPGTEHFLGTFYLKKIKLVFHFSSSPIVLIIHHTSRAHAPWPQCNNLFCTPKVMML